MSPAIRTSKVIKLWIQIFTYSAVTFCIFVSLGIEPFGIKQMIIHLLPITFNQWWFASTYFVFYLFTPYINRLLRTFNKKEYQCFLSLLTFCWCIIPTFLKVSWQCNALLWFVYLYAIAGYIRFYVNLNDINGKNYIICSCVLLIVRFLTVVFFDVLGTNIPIFAEQAVYFYDMQRLPTLLIPLTLFVGLLKIDIGYRRMVNVVSSATFGVYLIHDAGYVRTFLWNSVFKNASYTESNMLIPYSIMVILVVFTVCTIIELMRIHLLEKHYIKLIEAFSGVVDKYIEKFFSHKIFNNQIG